eukprot:13728019-Alexandrium_andersonii.AAC.1
MHLGVHSAGPGPRASTAGKPAGNLDQGPDGGRGRGRQPRAGGNSSRARYCQQKEILGPVRDRPPSPGPGLLPRPGGLRRWGRDRQGHRG